MRVSTVVALVVIALILTYAIWVTLVSSSLSDRTWTFGSLEIKGDGIDDIVTLVTSTPGGVTDGRFDSFDSPQGTDYVVPSGSQLRVILVEMDLHDVELNYVFGYGDDSVANSAAAPTNAVVLIEFISPAGNAHVEHAVGLLIPAGKHPFMFVEFIGGAPHVWGELVIGILEDVP